MYLSSKSDLERNGVDTSNLLAMFGLTGEEVQDIKLLIVDIIDGYHRFGALMLIRKNPALLLNADLQIDWEILAVRYPTWIKIDRFVIAHGALYLLKRVFPFRL